MQKLSILSRIILFILYFQTLFFKFTASEESVYIFTKLGVEPYGRIFTGVLELVICILLIFSTTHLYASILSLLVISGAILSHIFFLGIVVKEDDGLLFFLSLIIFILSVINLIINKEKLINELKKWRK
jgi:uncharacterized membrane protein YphA (DoxX/SURF4 family)